MGDNVILATQWRSNSDAVDGGERGFLPPIRTFVFTADFDPVYGYPVDQRGFARAGQSIRCCRGQS